MTKCSVILIIIATLACSPRIQNVQKEAIRKTEYEHIVGRDFKVMENKVAGSDRNFTSHYYLKITGLMTAASMLNNLERMLEGDGYRHVATTRNALTSLLYKRKTAKFIFFNDKKNKQVDLWFDRVFPESDKYLKGVDLHITIRILTSNQSSPNTTGVKFPYTN